MAHEYETGWVAHTAAWHRLADIKGERPATWEEARKGYLDWEPYTGAVYRETDNGFEKISGWQHVTRDDNDYTLSLQEDSYAVISNREFGNIIEYIMGLDIPGMPGFQYETLSVLRKGRIIAVSLFLEEPFHVTGDPSNTYGFFNVWTRHDGMGGLKGGPGTFRVVCANTMRASDAQMERNGFAFNIRHTANWADRVNEARSAIIASVGGIAAQQELASELVRRRVDPSEISGFVQRWLPITDDMTDLARRNQERKQKAFWDAYASATCEGITGTAYGVAQAAIEVCDHSFPARSLETRTTRIMLGEHPHKARALALASKWV